MKLKNMGRITKAFTVSLALGLGLTACSRDYTVAYVYVTSAKTNPGLINAYSVDYQSGALLQLADSPIPAGRNPVALISTTSTATGNQFVFVVNHDDSTVGTYAVGTDGKLYAEQNYNTTGSFPVAAAVDAAGKFLYVAYTFETGFTTASPGPGGISVFPITYSGSGASETVALGAPTNVNIGNNPVGITASKFHNFVYVVDAETPAGSAPIGEVLGYSENATTGALTPLPGVKALGTGLSQYQAGVSPSAIVENPLSSFVYVTDKTSNQLIGYLVLSDGSLSPMVNGPFVTGQFPVALTIDPRGSFLYVVNFNASTVSAYAINAANGTPTNSVGGSTTVLTNPVAIAIEPALGIYLYTANNSDGTVSGEQLSPNNGGLTQIQHSPFPASGLPTSIIAIPNGLHSTSLSVTTPTQ
ncbi:lactonase family protein [Granulicella arctica]|uniref:lactonase family protein n=1 Tax=Granulicella arctica TaxID=940613 RepID=UPI0021E0026D|nr:lactonase family protein [Granulicella arctica]